MKEKILAWGGMIMLFALCGLNATAGCCPNSKADEKSNERYVMDKLSYVKDPRTNTCFALYYPTTQWGLMATVPCTPEIEKLLVP